MLWKDGTNYMGEWKRNRPSGFGFEAYPNGSYYQGTFENDLRDGIGVYEFPDGLYYSGGWRHGKRYGSGIATDIKTNKFVLTYDRNGKLLSKHQFASQPAGDSFAADTAEREVVAEVLRVTLHVRRVAEAARKIAAKEFRSRGGVLETALKSRAATGDSEGEDRVTKQAHGIQRALAGEEAVTRLHALRPESAARLDTAAAAAREKAFQDSHRRTGAFKKTDDDVKASGTGRVL